MPKININGKDYELKDVPGLQSRTSKDHCVLRNHQVSTIIRLALSRMASVSTGTAERASAAILKAIQRGFAETGLAVARGAVF
jgi:hypothetical protein